MSTGALGDFAGLRHYGLNKIGPVWIRLYDLQFKSPGQMVLFYVVLISMGCHALPTRGEMVYRS